MFTQTDQTIVAYGGGNVSCVGVTYLGSPGTVTSKLGTFVKWVNLFNTRRKTCLATEVTTHQRSVLPMFDRNEEKLSR